MPGVKRVQLDGWGSHAAGKVICVDSDRSTNSHMAAAPAYHYYHNSFHAQNQPMFKQESQPTLSSSYTSKQHPYMYGQSPPPPPSIDAAQVEIARHCTAIAKQVPHLPISLHECSVCLSSNAHTQIAPCGHIFHSRCFLRWYRSNRTCPMCRGGVDRVQVAAPVLEEVDVLMAYDSDDDNMDVTSVSNDPSSLMEDTELLSFLTQDDATSSPSSASALSDDTDLLPMEDMEILEDLASFDEKPLATTYAMPPPPTPLAFSPATTMPNYWMVLNNHGQTLLPVHPTAARVVPIAPRPNAPVTSSHHFHGSTKPLPSSTNMVVLAPSSTKMHSCRCAGGCRNGRCACVKEGSMCGITCRCTSCKNPFLSIAMAGIDVSSLIKDDCFMHNLSKIRDMMTKLHERLPPPCCDTSSHDTLTILDCIDGYTCKTCDKVYDFSWCSNKLCDREKHKRNHCSKCKRCGDHRDVHCDNCNRCYFAGVSSSFACACQEKIKEAAKSTSGSGAAAARGGGPSATTADDGEEGECSIM
ncbi:hypothetical protein DYB25_005449 [Aphanomyces astaci]|uniref:RING-type domain-containing protein n=1 Tax=Aphanomyces astaci TaxID=112090 RepID=A0A397BAP2_APHAT|nr:hypothetical protein DYB25_005449 [Aphanomyces astaci]RHY57735.1 hypothetical protein DYB34_000537 [Aphanomyces astaci]RHY69864.1 hypothetical protein DYB30_010766 [Aphanomyces astaci]RHZ28334.1 hypothetical protein DYB31_007417 [Aphanomyces astaci]